MLWALSPPSAAGCLYLAMPLLQRPTSWGEPLFRLGVAVYLMVVACYIVVTDLFYDLFKHSLSACRRVLNPSGIYIVNGGPNGRWMGPLTRGIIARVLSRFVSQSLVMFLTRRSKEDLAVMHELMRAGKVTPVIDRSYTLSEVPEAIRYLEEGHARGKVVITLEYNNKT